MGGGGSVSSGNVGNAVNGGRVGGAKREKCNISPSVFSEEIE